MMSCKPKPVAKPTELLRPSSAIVLDHPTADKLEAQHLAALAHRLFAGGIAHLTLIGAGDVDPQGWTWEPFGAWSAAREQAIDVDACAFHYAAANIGLTLLPAQSGRAMVLAAARLQYRECGAGPVTVAEFDRIMMRIVGPAPDLIIVTGGLRDLSGSLTWSAAYAELVFFDQRWTKLTTTDLDQALGEFGRRNRRFGGTATAGAR